VARTTGLRAPYASRMSVCPSCGRENAGEARFCSECGTRLSSEASARREERKIVSILFADLVGFTARSERLDPEDVRAIQMPYFQRVRAEIEARGGTVEKFIGDAVMGVFGAPVAHGDDPERAVRAALAIRDGVAELNAGKPELDLQVRVAVNTGEAIVSLGAATAQGESLVAGDVVNTASRLQSLAPVNGVLVGEETYRSTKSIIDYRPVEPVSLKGKSQPVAAWVAVGAGAPPGERRGRSAPIVGRDHELGVLQRIWEQVVAEQRPHLVTVFGPAGIGKTRLAAEFSRLIEEDGGRAIRGRSAPYGEKTTYGAFAQHVKQIARVFDSDLSAEARTKLREAVTELMGDAEANEISAHIGSLIGLESEGADAAGRDELFYSARRLLEEVARRQPTVLVFEDLHWADAGTLDLLEMLASRMRDVPLLLLALARPELLEHRASWGGGLSGYAALQLEPLGQAQSRELAERLLEETGFEPDVIVGTAEGNPLFIEELAASVSERAAGGTGDLPTSIRAIVTARLDALPSAERRVLLDASVVGKTFWRGALEGMESGGDGLGEVLESLERRDFVRREPISRLVGEQQFTFKHVLIRDIAYATLPRPGRRERHATVARFLEDKTHEGLAAASALAHHWLEAGEKLRAAEFLVVAGDQAGRGWAKDEAVAFYREALAVLPEDETERRREITRRQAVALVAVVHVADAKLLGRRPAPADGQA
jgi:class 3 adenylate cyclase